MVTHGAWPRLVQGSATERYQDESLALAVHLEEGRLVEGLGEGLVVVVLQRQVAFAGRVTVHIAPRQE
jgi:hypothetical protein